jgi:AcrR family transcriptional regulator
MPPVPEFQRARRPEHKEERREAILLAARELAVERSVREVSLGDIARRVGLAKSNVLRYFETREEVYLRLLVREWEAWQVDVAVQLWSGAPTPDVIAETLAVTLAERSLLCDLLSQMAATLERNVSAETARAFKTATIQMVSDLGEVITELLPGIDPEDGRETVAAAIVIVGGLWPMANPSPRVREMLVDTPELLHGRVDFEGRLKHLLTALIVGFLPIEDV